jgi:hypothetical protein
MVQDLKWEVKHHFMNQVDLLLLETCLDICFMETTIATDQAPRIR